MNGRTADGRFRNREEAATELLRQLRPLKAQRPLVLGIPRGAMPMAKIIADGLGGEMDVVLVKKIGHPSHPELALGSVTEDGDFYMGYGASKYGFSEQFFEERAIGTAETLRRKRKLYTQGQPPLSPQGRTVIIVDDGIATGATMVAAVRSLKAKGAARIIAAAPVASHQAIQALEAEGAEVQALHVPEHFGAVGYYYENFAQVSDAEVGSYFRLSPAEVEIEHLGGKLKATLGVAENPKGVVVFAHGFGSGQQSPRNQFLAEFLNHHGLCTVLADLFTAAEKNDVKRLVDIDVLSQRLTAIEMWAREQNFAKNLPFAYFGAGTGGGAAIRAAATSPRRIAAVVLRGGRPDLAKEHLLQTHVPTLLIVGQEDEPIILLNRFAFSKMRSEKKLVIIPGAGHLFEESGALEQVAEHAVAWFIKHFDHHRFQTKSLMDEHKRGH